MKTTEFRNVCIGISAENPNEAYTKLCNALASIDAEWTTDTFVFEPDWENERSTGELFPVLE